MISALKQTRLKRIIQTMQSSFLRYSMQYVIGCTGTGKSTFLNALMKQLNLSKILLTTSERLQTTVDFIKIPFGKNRCIIDTPGYVNPENIGAYLSFESLRYLLPKQYLKVRTYQLNAGQSLFLGGFGQIDFEVGTKMSAACFVANTLYLHRTQLCKAPQFFDKQLGRLLMPPKTEAEIVFSQKRKTTEYSFSGCYDLVISGVGFVHINGENVKISVSTPEPVHVVLVPTFIVAAEGEKP